MTKDEFIKKHGIPYERPFGDPQKHEKLQKMREKFINDLDELLSGKAAQIIAVVREEWSVDNDEAVYDEIKRILK
jgi:hypothetical protein